MKSKTEERKRESCGTSTEMEQFPQCCCIRGRNRRPKKPKPLARGAGVVSDVLSISAQLSKPLCGEVVTASVELWKRLCLARK